MIRASAIKHFLSAATLLLMASCANVVTPEGGPKDTLPPMVVLAEPPSGALSFSARAIDIRFNEFIQLKEVSKNVLISPPMLKAPDFRIKGRTLHIVLRDSLRPATTYCLNFGGAIADLNEANILAGYQYVFSTGPYRDSLTSGGTVVNARSGSAEAGVMIMLYSQPGDSVPYLKGPDYIARSGSGGEFTFSTLPPGSYQLFALRDKDGDYLYSQPSEEIAFLDSLVVPVPRDTGRKAVVVLRHSLRLFKEELKKIYMTGKNSEAPGYFQLFFNRSADSLQLTPLKTLPAGALLTRWNSGHDTLTGWVRGLKLDTLKLDLRAATGLRDTVELPFVLSSKAQKMGKGVTVKKASWSSPAVSGFQDHDRPLLIALSNPLDTLNREKISLTEDNTPVNYEMTYADTLRLGLLFQYPWKEGKKYKLLAAPGAFTDVMGVRSDSIRITFGVRSPKDYGLLRVMTDSVPEGYILQLLSEKGELLAEKVCTKKNTTVTFEKVLPGKLSLRLIADRNRDGRWTTGDYLKKRQPERVILYNKPVLIKADWETEVDWKENFSLYR